MNKFTSTYIILSFSILLLNKAWANEIKIEILDYGIYKQKAQFNKIPESDAVSGYSFEAESNNSVSLVEETTTIPLIKGTIFGFRANVLGLKERTPVTITIRCEHPLIKKPGGTSSSLYEFDTVISKESGLPEGGFMFILSNDYEMVSGKWKFMVLQGKHILVEKQFITSEI